MEIFVTVKPRSKNPSIERIDETHLRVNVREVPKENEANFAVLTALSRHFNVPSSFIKLLKGKRGKEKVFEITI